MNEDLPPIWLSVVVFILTATLALNFFKIIDLIREKNQKIVKSYLVTEILEKRLDETRTILWNIALCESENNPYAKNPHSSASGRFQFIKSSWNYYGTELWGANLNNKDVLSWEDNTELAQYVYKRNGTRDWEESRGCWGAKVLNDVL